MTRIPSVNWAEGMFLRPQHLQLSSRQVEAQVAAALTTALPFAWGFVDLAVAADQLEKFSFDLDRCAVVFKDGTRGAKPVDLVVERRDFKQQLDESDGTLAVYLGVAALRDGERNTFEPGAGTTRSDVRYVTDVVEVSDENLGGAEQQIEVRKLRGRFFFGAESREGYECLKVAELRRAGYGRNAPELVGEYIPPVLVTAAWPVLAKLAESILNRLEAKHRFLRAEVSEGRVNLEVVGGAGWQPVLKLQIVGAFLHVFRQLAGAPVLHPFPVYVEMARLAGELSIFEEEGAEAVQIPVYDHAQLGPCFHTATYTVERLLEKILSGSFVRVPFEPDKDLLVASFKAEWLTAESEIYLCVESDLPDRSILSRIEVAKIGARADLPLLSQRRLFGLDILLLNRTPGGLPAREDFHYFSIGKEGQYWESVVKTREMAIAGGLDAKLSFSLYVVLRPEPRAGR